jgi:hypothetical protein
MARNKLDTKTLAARTARTGNTSSTGILIMASDCDAPGFDGIAWTKSHPSSPWRRISSKLHIETDWLYREKIRGQRLCVTV